MCELKDINEMTSEEMIEEIAENQTKALHLLSEHDLQHILIDLRVGEYKRSLAEQIGHQQTPEFSRSEFPEMVKDNLHRQGFL